MYFKNQNDIIFAKNSTLFFSEDHVIVQPDKPSENEKFIYLKIFIEKNNPEIKVNETNQLMFDMGFVYIDTDQEYDFIP